MKKVILIVTLMLLSVSLFAAFPKNTFSSGLSLMGVEGIGEERSAIAIGGYVDDKLVFGERKKINLTALARNDFGYAVDQSSLNGILWNFFSGTGALFRPIGGLEIEACLGLGLFAAISDDPIFDVTAGALTSLSYAFGGDDAILITLGCNAVYGFIFKSVYFSAYLGAGIRF